MKRGYIKMTEYLSFSQAVEYLGFKSYNALYRYIKLGLPVSQVGKSKRIAKSDIDKFMADHTVVVKHDK